MRDTSTKGKLDWSRLLGFEQITDRRHSQRDGSSVGQKIGDKLGSKNLIMPR